RGRLALRLELLLEPAQDVLERHAFADDQLDRRIGRLRRVVGAGRPCPERTERHGHRQSSSRDAGPAARRAVTEGHRLVGSLYGARKELPDPKDRQSVRTAAARQTSWIAGRYARVTNPCRFRWTTGG